MARSKLTLSGGILVGLLAVASASCSSGSNSAASSSPTSASSVATTSTTATPLVVDPVASRCGEEGKIVSPGSTDNANIKFVNQTGQALRVYWLDFAGGRKSFADLAAGESYTQASFVGHAWLVADRADRCVRLATVDAASSPVTVTG